MPRLSDKKLKAIQQLKNYVDWERENNPNELQHVLDFALGEILDKYNLEENLSEKTNDRTSPTNLRLLTK